MQVEYKNKNIQQNFITSSSKTSYDRKITVITKLQEMFNLNDLTDGKLRTFIGGILGGLSGVYLLDANSFLQLALKSFYSLMMIGLGAWVTSAFKAGYNYSVPYIKEYFRKVFKRKEKEHKVKRNLD